MRYNLAGAYGGVGRWEDAIAQLEAAESIRPGAATNRWLAYARLAKAGVSPEKVPAYSERLASAENPTSVWLEITRELVENQQITEAREILDGLSDERAEVLFFRALVMAAEERKEEALAAVNEVLDRSPRLGQAHLFRAELLASMGRDEELVRLTDVRLDDSRENALLGKARAMAFLRMRRFEDALVATDIEVNRAHFPILSAARAAALLLLGRTEEAREVVENGDGPGADTLLLESVRRQLGAQP